MLHNFSFIHTAHSLIPGAHSVIHAAHSFMQVEARPHERRAVESQIDCRHYPTSGSSLHDTTSLYDSSSMNDWFISVMIKPHRCSSAMHSGCSFIHYYSAHSFITILSHRLHSFWSSHLWIIMFNNQLWRQDLTRGEQSKAKSTVDTIVGHAFSLHSAWPASTTAAAWMTVSSTVSWSILNGAHRPCIQPARSFIIILSHRLHSFWSSDLWIIMFNNYLYLPFIHYFVHHPFIHSLFRSLSIHSFIISQPAVISFHRVCVLKHFRNRLMTTTSQPCSRILPVSCTR